MGPVAKEVVKVTWRAPEQLAGVVTVYATVVQVIFEVGEEGFKVVLTNDLYLTTIFLRTRAHSG